MITGPSTVLKIVAGVSDLWTSVVELVKPIFSIPSISELSKLPYFTVSVSRNSKNANINDHYISSSRGLAVHLTEGHGFAPETLQVAIPHLNDSRAAGAPRSRTIWVGADHFSWGQEVGPGVFVLSEATNKPYFHDFLMAKTVLKFTKGKFT